MSPELSPYAPPRAPIPAAGTVDVKQGDTLPLVCLKCGANHDVAGHPRTLMVLGRARIATLAVALGGGITVAVVRSPNTRLVVFLGLALVAILVRRFLYPGVAMPVALCASCVRRWDSGVRWSKILRASLIASSAAITVLVLAETSPLLVVVVMVGMLAIVISLLLLRMRSRIVVVREMKRGVMTLALVHPDAVAAIHRARA